MGQDKENSSSVLREKTDLLTMIAECEITHYNTIGIQSNKYMREGV